MFPFKKSSKWAYYLITMFFFYRKTQNIIISLAKKWAHWVATFNIKALKIGNSDMIRTISIKLYDKNVHENKMHLEIKCAKTLVLFHTPLFLIIFIYEFNITSINSIFSLSRIDLQNMGWIRLKMYSGMKMS